MNQHNPPSCIVCKNDVIAVYFSHWLLNDIIYKKLQHANTIRYSYNCINFRCWLARLGLYQPIIL